MTSPAKPAHLMRSNFDGKRFHNAVPRSNELRSLLRWLLSRDPGPWREWSDAPPGPPPPKRTQGLRVTFVNHTTFLLQLDGLNILTDPIWSDRAGPLSWLGPKRHRPPGIRFEDLPPIDAVLLSHDHYDHMDIPTLQRLQREHHPATYTGLRNSATLSKHGIDNVTELDWWDVADSHRLRFTAIPAQHFSGRSPFDRNTTLWCGFVVQGQAATVCFAGDTAMGPHFPQVAQQFPDIDVAILPIGAFRPQWFMGAVHMSPDEAVRAHLQLGAKISIASHFGTFRLADDGQDEPAERLHQALEHNDLGNTEFWVMDGGEGREISRAYLTSYPEGSAVDSRDLQF